ncbi:MAG: DNA-binding protein [Acidimicrobiales bacterium]|nr:DNA-binding protein [Hyphomonadaceae bacterium]RZV41653.1 MAG: DNA-binding protein [Acidimicrobiales bacterium]
MSQILPEITDENAAFWQGGEDGKLMITQCDDCAFYIHPPSGFCVKCRSKNVSPKPVSGKGKVASFTINHQQWLPDLKTPYTVAIVELVEQKGLRFVTNITGCDPETVHIDMPVEVNFQNHEDVWLPLFSPVTGRTAS